MFVLHLGVEALLLAGGRSIDSPLGIRLQIGEATLWEIER
jgi:hypothetical protein